MRYLMVSAAAAMAIAGAATIATAQDEKGKGPEGKAPGAAQQGPGKSEQPRAQPTPNRAEQPKSEAPKGAQREPGAQQPKAAQQPQRNGDQPKSSQQQQPGKDQPRAAQQRQEPAKDQPKSAQPQQRPEPGKDQQKSVQPQQQPGKDQQKSTQQDTNKQPERAQVSEQQRTSVRESIVKDTKIERTRINVSVNVGTAIPRSVRLHTLPVAIVSLAPAYRGYSYVVLEDETIIIVEPRTYIIVDVLPAGTQRADRPGRTHLTLNAEQTRFIFTTVDRNRTANVNVRLALGAEVPRNVELLSFPADVAARVPSVARYRYIVSRGDVIVVDPSDNAVVLVINE